MRIIRVRSFDTFDSVIVGRYNPRFAVVPDEFPGDDAEVSQRRRGTFAYDAERNEWPCFGHGETAAEAAEDAEM